MEGATASTVARYILLHCKERDGASISNLKLQKLLYYTQAFHLAIHDSTLFDDRIEAWVHGPVSPSVFAEYREYKWRSIKREIDEPCLDEVSIGLIDEVLRVYGGFTASELERLTHREDPWLNARGGIAIDCPSNEKIKLDDMRVFYRDFLEDLTRRGL